MRKVTTAVVAACLLTAGPAAAQTGGRPAPIRVPSAGPAVSGAPQPSAAALATLSATPTQVEFNVLKGQVAALQTLVAQLQGQLDQQKAQLASQGKAIDGLKQAVATVSLKGITNANDIVAVNTQIEALKAADVAQKEAFDHHTHYEFVTTFQDDKQQFVPRTSSIPSQYCKLDPNGVVFGKVKCKGPD